MAVIRDNIVVAPSVDTVAKAKLDSTSIAPGIYTVNESVTISGITSSRWTVICLANNDAMAISCYSQIWITSANGTSGANQNMFMRTINADGTSFGSFSRIVTEEYLKSTSTVNKTSYPMEIYAQNSQPTAAAGKTIIWIDTTS